MRAFFSKHKKFIIILILTLEIITIIPVIYGFAATSAETYFDGVSNLAPGDFSLYLSYFEQVKQGNWFFEDFYTGERQTANFFNPFFLLFGLIGKIFTLPNIATYHIARTIMIPIFIVMLLFFLELFFKNKKSLYVAAIMIIFSSGVGAWIAPFFKSFSYTDNIRGYFHWPMDLWVPEFNTFLTLYHNPLYIASLTLILLVFFLFIKSIGEQKILWSVLAGLCGFLLFLIHPYHIPTIYIVSALWTLAMVFKKQLRGFLAIKYWGILFLLSFPAAIYQIIFLFTDPIMNQRYSNTGGPPTALWLTAIAYGFLLLFALPEIWRQIQIIIKKEPLPTNDQRLLFNIIWLLGGILLVYMPVFQHTRRLTEGLQIPLAIFAATFLFRQAQTDWYRKLKKIANTRIILIIAFLLFLGTSTIYAVAQDIDLYATKHPKVHIPIQIYDGILWIKKHTTNRDVIITDLLIGNLLPGIAGRHVYIGHTSETALYNLKERWLFAFFSQNRDEASELRFLSENRISYIFFTDSLKEMGTWRPENKDYLSKVFENEKAVIYKVR